MAVNLDFPHKTLFLIALASGRRRSELHALRSDGPYMRFSRDESSVTLKTDQTFLAKNQVPAFTPDPIVIPALSKILGKDDVDLWLCPVRALRWYLKRTEKRRKSPSRLFLPILESRETVAKSSISRWIGKVIHHAYQNSHTESHTLHQVRAHEVRALSASFALMARVPFQDFMSAGFWRSDSSFTNFYLRSLAQHSEWLYSLGPVVCAQTVISSTPPCLD